MPFLLGLAMAFLLSALQDVSAKECTNIPSQPQSLREREREYAMRQILLLAGGAHSHAHDHPHFPDHSRLLLADGTVAQHSDFPSHVHGLDHSHAHEGEREGEGEAGSWLQRLTSSKAKDLLSPWHRGLTSKEKANLRGLIRREKQRQARWGPRGPLGSFLSDIPLSHVRLLPGTPQHDAQETNLRYLLMLDPDSLLWSFRHTAGVPAPGKPYGGWESPGSELRGHFVGHFLSATALAWASTGNDSVKVLMDYVVNELDTCQKAIGTGYLSAFPAEFFDRFEAIQPVWAPYYTIHKIMAGLLDQYQLAENLLALSMAAKMAAYFAGRVEHVIERFTIERHWQSLNEEFGGMNDVLYRLYSVTGESRHLHLAHLFDKPCFLGPLALKTDDLSGFHSNTHIPIVIGSQSRYEVTGDVVYRGISEHFMELVNASHAFSSGGTSSFEFWHDPHRQGDQLAQEDQESCTTYNMLKISRNLFRWTRRVVHADYYEKALVNGVLGIQRGTHPGVMIYMLPHGPGNSKARGYHGWGDPFNSFWCCYGTGVESFAKLGDSVYYQRPVSRATPVPALYIAQYVSSVVSWYAAGLEVTQRAAQPTSADPVLRVTVSVREMEGEREEEGAGEGSGGTAGSLTARSLPAGILKAGSLSELRLRVPGWLAPSGAPKPSRDCPDSGGCSEDADACTVALNGEVTTCSRPGSFLRLRRLWSSGDSVDVGLRLGVRCERIQDDRVAYRGLHSIFVGPHLLVGLTEGDNRLHPSFDPARPGEHLTPVPPGANQQLVTLVASGVEGVPYKGTWVLSGNEGGKRVFLYGMPGKGSDGAPAATFRVLGVVGGLTSASRVAMGLELFTVPDSWQDAEVSFEPFNLPGHVLCMNTSTGALNTERLSTLLRQGRERSSAARSHVFRFVPDNASPGEFSLMLADSMPSAITASGSPTLYAGLRANKFALARGVAQYAKLTYAVKGLARDFLLQPISFLQDESYTSYFNISAKLSPLYVHTRGTDLGFMGL